MNRKDYPMSARTALDRFDVPPLSAGFVDRVVAAAAVTGTALPPHRAPVPPRRRRGGLWRRAGQAAIGLAAFGTMSAAAVASGLLGAVGIEVPVLSAMLAPAPAKVAKPKPPAKTAVQLSRREAEPSPPPVVQTVAPPLPAIDSVPAPWQQALFERRAARRAANQAAREAFLASHPGLAEALAAGPEARRAYLAQNPAVRAEIRARMAERQARRAAGRAAMIQRQRARLDDPAMLAPAGGGPPGALGPLSPEARAAMVERRRARQAELQALDPAARAARIAAFKARREARRAFNARMRASPMSDTPAPGEGFAPPVR